VEEIETTGLLRFGWLAARQNQATYLPRNLRRNKVPVNLFLANDSFAGTLKKDGQEQF
jgi:hypothetical protein